MIKKKIGKFFFLILIFITISTIIYLKFFKANEIEEKVKLDTQEQEDINYSSNIIKDVNFTTKNADGNEYTITALKGEIDYSNPNILYLTDVVALIKLENSKTISITSDFGNYNTENFDTIFSKNVTVKFLDSQITGEYLDFSLKRNSILISKKVVYKSLNNFLTADVVEVNIQTKDMKVYMYENKKKVNIKVNE